MPHRLTKPHLPHDYHATSDSRGRRTLPLQCASPEGTFTWGEILPGALALTFLWLWCVPVPVLVWAWVSWATGVGWLLRSGFPVCVSAPRLPASGVPVRGALMAGGRRQW